MHCAARESETEAEEVPFSGERAIARHLHIKRLLYKIEKEELPMCKAFEELMKEERLADLLRSFSPYVLSGQCMHRVQL